MKKNIITLLGLMTIILIPCWKSAEACGYGHHLLNHLVIDRKEIVSFSSPKVLESKPEKGMMIQEVMVQEVLQGTLKKGQKIKFVCEDLLQPERCKLEGRKSPFLFLSGPSLKKTPATPSKGGSVAKMEKKTGVILRGHPLDGISLLPSDKPLLQAFIKNRKNPSAALASKVLASKRPYFIASLFALNPTPQLLRETLSFDSVADEVAALRVSIEKLPQFKGEEQSYCQVIYGDFNATHKNVINETELSFIGQSPCAGKGDFLFQQLASQNEFVVMQSTYYLSMTDPATVRKGVDFFKANPKQVSSIEVINQLSHSLFVQRECSLMKDLVGQYRPSVSSLQNLAASLFPSLAPNYHQYEVLAENYAGCLGHLPGSGPLLVSLLKGDSHPDWPFPGEVGFRVMARAITAIERQLWKQTLSPQTEGLKEALIDRAEKGHPQNVPEIMHLLKKYFPGTDEVIMRLALKKDAKSYHQSHAIMAFMQAGQKEKAIQVANAGRDPRIKKVGELLQGAGQTPPMNLPNPYPGQSGRGSGGLTR